MLAEYFLENKSFKNGYFRNDTEKNSWFKPKTGLVSSFNVNKLRGGKTDLCTIPGDTLETETIKTKEGMDPDLQEIHIFYKTV